MPLSPRLLAALADGRRDEAEAAGGLTIPSDWPDDHDRRFLRLRLDQVTRDPALEEWLPRAIALQGPRRRMIGHVGFHGRPGTNGPGRKDALEVGYTVFEPFRGRGYAIEAVRAVLAWARTEHGVRHFVASVGPWNDPSLAIVRRLGFRETGRQWDDEDGEELVFELQV